MNLKKHSLNLKNRSISTEQREKNRLANIRKKVFMKTPESLVEKLLRYAKSARGYAKTLSMPAAKAYYVELAETCENGAESISRQDAQAYITLEKPAPKMPKI